MRALVLPLLPLLSLPALALFAACEHDEGPSTPPVMPTPPATCPDAWSVPPAVDPALALPAAGIRVVAHVSARGTQNYECAASTTDGGAGFAWTLRGPDAALTDCNGAPFGKHYASDGEGHPPKWEANDGSYVIAKKVAAAPVKNDPTAVPWLLLQVTGHGGAGALAGVDYVHRVGTAGGAAPVDGCDAAHVGASQKIPYAAAYWFYGR